MSKMFPQSVLFLVLLLCLMCSTGWSASPSVSVEPKIGCIEEERRALLNIKHNLYGIWNYSIDDLLSSWGNGDEKRDCCKWVGIRCANESGHVVSLDLSPSVLGITDYSRLPALEGKISPSLFELRYLTFLNFSGIDFTGSQIPSSMGTLTQLRYLSLSSTNMDGEIPPQLANLSRLEVLDLAYNYIMSPKNLEWLSHLSSLRILDMSGTNLSRATDWAQRVNQLPSLTALRLSSCYLPAIANPLSLSIANYSISLIDLDISYNMLSGPIFPWVFNSSNSLSNLDLSFNQLEGSIPEAFNKMTALRTLDLSNNKLHGSIPEAFSNMTSLIALELMENQLNGTIPEVFSKMNALTRLSLSYNQLHGSVPKGFENTTALESLSLNRNNLHGSIPEGFSKMTALRTLDLRDNKLHGSIPEEFTKMTSLKHLELSGNELNGSIPEIFGNMSDLELLKLGNNMLEGEIPRSIWNLSSLNNLSLRSNNLGGHIPEVMSQLKLLETFDISRNVFQGEISHAHFSNLSKLTHLALTSNSVSLKFHTNWTPPFQLELILLGSCMLGPHFPTWLRSQWDYSVLNISNSGISDSIPNWFWSVSATFILMDLSNNRIHGGIMNNVSVEMGNFMSEIDLSSNLLEGSVPFFLFRVYFLNLFQNRFSKLSLLCNVTIDMPLQFLDISNNELSEELPDCFLHLKSLEILVLTYNKLSGRVPSSIGWLNKIKSLTLNNNKFVGEFPSTLKNCTELVVFDFGANNLSGMIPSWLGKNLSKLSILSLRSNCFHGGMPNSLCHLSNLQVLDLSFNDITGSIPKCISNFTAMRTDGSRATGTRISLAPGSVEIYSDGESFGETHYDEKAVLEWKGKKVEFRSTLALVKSIDLSSNKLNGEIPREMTELSGLVSLNLSRNNLSEQIPAEIGGLKSLDPLDLSRNQLVGHIPQSLALIDRLNTLDLSFNNLSGKIPTGTQLQSFPAAYLGNPELCGKPLPKNCSDMGQATPEAADEESDELFNRGFYISMAIGFTIAFWGVCGALIFKKSFRYAYFKLLNDIGDRVYVTTAIQKAKLLRMIKG